MSDTTTGSLIAAPTAREMANESLLSPQFLLGAGILAIVAAVSAAVIYRGDAAQINLVLGAVFGLGSMASGFFFGSSKSSQGKDAVIAAKMAAPAAPAAPGTTTTTTVQGPTP